MSNRISNLQNQIVQDKFKLTVDGGILTENERQFYEDNGYFVVKQMFSKEDIQSWNNRFIEYAEGKLEKLRGMQVVRDVSIAKKGLNKAFGEQAITKIQDWQEDPVLFTFCNHPKMIPYLKSFCGPTSAKSVHTMFINKPPNVGSTSRHPIHQDQVYFPFGPADRIVAGWASLEDANQVNGCLTVYPKSHKLGPLQHAYPDWEGGVNKSYFGVKELPKMERIYLEMKAGDIVFFHPYLLHGSGENRSQGYRKSICCHFASADCTYHDIKGTFHEQLADEIMTVAKKLYGPDMIYHDLWRFKVKQVYGEHNPQGI